LPAFANEADVDAKITMLRQEIIHISDLAPRWFTLNADGSLVSTLGNDAKLLQLFARYYRVRMLPVVEVAPGAALNAESLIAQAAKSKVDGFVLLFTALPASAEMDAFSRALGTANLRVLALSVDSAKNTGKIKSLSDNSDLLSGTGTSADIIVQPWTGKDGTHKPLSEMPSDKPFVVIF